MTALAALGSDYTDAQQLDPKAFIKPVSFSVSDRGLVRLEQAGAVLILTPSELSRLAQLTT